jgi:dihydrolipoamide dehydrogenase
MGNRSPFCPWRSRQAIVHALSGDHASAERVVGVELAQAWASLGASVALIEDEPRVLHTLEEFASEQVAAGLEESGVELHLGERAESASRNGKVRVALRSGRSLEGDELLVATGRTPRTSDLGLERVGVEAGGFLEVDERMRVGGREWLYAVGDVNGRALLTHTGKYQARVCAEVILGRDAVAGADAARPPQVVFCDPEVASVGHTLASAEEEGIDAIALDTETASTPGASFRGRNAPGTSRLVVERQSEAVVGATFVGPEVAEWLHAASIAVSAGVTMPRLREAIPAYPTRSEIWLKLQERFEELRR